VKRLLVAVDDSADSLAAARLAIDLALASKILAARRDVMRLGCDLRPWPARA
jgi:hypothetical protein